MTFITKLTSTFSDTTLPRLLSDPVWNEAGGRVLFDSKNLICHPAQASTITASTALASAGENSWPITNSTTHDYNSTTGRITQLGAGGGSTYIRLENSGANNAGPYSIFNNATHDYAGVLWFYAPASHTATNPALFAKGVGNNSSSQTLTISFDASSNVLRVCRPKSTDSGFNNNALVTSALSAGVHRIAFAWSKASGTWTRYGLLNQATAVTNNGSTDTFSTGTDGINLPTGGATWDADLFGNLGSGYFNFTNCQAGIYRFYLENLTQSGRTRTQVWDADWAYANGRFS